MRLDQATWLEVEDYLTRQGGILLPVGSTEQHGPAGLIGTDAFCAQMIADAAAEVLGVYVAPTIAYAPAPFNTGFPGTISVSEPVFAALFSEIVQGLGAQGFSHVYVLNGHGANLAPMRAASAGVSGLRIRSWWDFEEVDAIRRALYGAFEGMHATPSEIAITQTAFRRVTSPMAEAPPPVLSPRDMAARAGDRHGSPEQHRREFPDGRVGSHSALARPEDGERLLSAAMGALVADFRDFVKGA